MIERDHSKLIFNSVKDFMTDNMVLVADRFREWCK